MPPSGFSQKAVNGLLRFVEANYALLESRYVGGSEKEFLETSADALERQVRTTLAERFPDTEEMNGGVSGLATFVVECYRDLAAEIVAGKDKHSRPVVDGCAIQKELDQIGAYLKKFTI